MEERLADWGLIGAGRYWAEKIDSAHEKDQVFALRYLVYCEQLKQIPKERFPDQKETDWCDEHSTLIAAKRNGEIIGCIRLIECSKGCLLDEGSLSARGFKFPVLCGNRVLQRSVCVEASRWIGKSFAEETGERVAVSRLLLQAALHYAKNAGIQGWVWALNARVYGDLIADGWPLHELIPGVQEYHGARVVVCGMAVDDEWGRFRKTLG